MAKHIDIKSRFAHLSSWKNFKSLGCGGGRLFAVFIPNNFAARSHCRILLITTGICIKC